MKLIGICAKGVAHVHSVPHRAGARSIVTQVYRTSAGWPFLGFRIYPHRLRLRRETWRRAQKRLGLRHHLWQRGELTTLQLQQAVQSMMVHLERAQSRGLRRKELRWSEC